MMKRILLATALSGTMAFFGTARAQSPFDLSQAPVGKQAGTLMIRARGRRHSAGRGQFRVLDWWSCQHDRVGGTGSRFFLFFHRQYRGRTDRGDHTTYVVGDRNGGWHREGGNHLGSASNTDGPISFHAA